MRFPDLQLWLDLWIVIQGGDTQNHIPSTSQLSHEVRTTGGTEIPLLARRRGKRFEQLLSFDPTDMRMIDLSGCIESGRMGLPARPAGAMFNR